jgi:hypothetical protein
MTYKLDHFMSTYRQPGLFDFEDREEKLTALGDPLVTLKSKIDFEAFRADLSRVYEKSRKSNAGAKPFDVVLMGKVMILQHMALRQNLWVFLDPAAYLTH